MPVRAGPERRHQLRRRHAVEVLGGVERFANFMRFLDAPQPSANTPGGATSIANGRQKFVDVGCALCHTPSFTTSTSTVAALSKSR
jgi:CxxC motif-containing protein (DUF1111 family)